MKKFKKVDQLFAFDAYSNDNVYRLVCTFKSKSISKFNTNESFDYAKVQPDDCEYNVNDPVIMKVLVKLNGIPKPYVMNVKLPIYEEIQDFNWNTYQENNKLVTEVQIDTNGKIVYITLPWQSALDTAHMTVEYRNRDLEPYKVEVPVSYMKYKVNRRKENVHANIVKENRIDKGLKLKLKNRRVCLGYNGKENYYILQWKHLTNNGKVHSESRAFTPEAMLGIVNMFFELHGPLPDHLEWIGHKQIGVKPIDNGCTCDNPEFGFDCICDWVKMHPGNTNYYCEYCGCYRASKPRCNKCKEG